MVISPVRKGSKSRRPLISEAVPFWKACVLGISLDYSETVPGSEFLVWGASSWYGVRGLRAKVHYTVAAMLCCLSGSESSHVD
jgi:hypothetical protein